MSEEEALIDAVLANPDDPTAKLIYADWLDERGDVRGAYIQMRCEMAGLRPRDERNKALQTRIKPLIGQIDSHWLKRLGFIVRDRYLRDATVVAFGLRLGGQYGSEEKAIKALANRQAYLGFSREDIEQDFYKALAIQNDIIEFKADLREKGGLTFVSNQLRTLQAFLRQAHPDVPEETISCAVGSHVTSWY